MSQGCPQGASRTGRGAGRVCPESPSPISLLAHRDRHNLLGEVWVQINASMAGASVAVTQLQRTSGRNWGENLALKTGPWEAVHPLVRSLLSFQSISCTTSKLGLSPGHGTPRSSWVLCRTWFICVTGDSIPFAMDSQPWFSSPPPCCGLQNCLTYSVLSLNWVEGR